MSNLTKYVYNNANLKKWKNITSVFDPDFIAYSIHVLYTWDVNTKPKVFKRSKSGYFLYEVIYKLCNLVQLVVISPYSYIKISYD